MLIIWLTFACQAIQTPKFQGMFWILFCITVFLFLYAILMAVYTIGWYRLPLFSMPKNFVPNTKVSVIIPARNEAENIEICLRSIFQNNYPKTLLEVIVVDDFSTDDTAAITFRMLENQRGKLLQLKNHLSESERINSYKKKALSIAIDQAFGDLIITTDADCICPPDWILHIVTLYKQTHAKFVVAPVTFMPAKKTNWLYFFQSLDFMMMQGITAAGTRLNLGSMCNGASLAFERAAFYEVGGYKGIDEIASGDDMLLLEKIKNRYPGSVHYLRNRKIIVRTPCQPTFRAFLNQRIRWASKSDRYKDKKLIAVLLAVYLLNVSLFVLFVYSFFMTQFQVGFFSLLVALVFKMTIELYFLIPVAKFFDKTEELFWFPILQPVHILYIIAAGFLGKFGSYKWKDRKVN